MQGILKVVTGPKAEARRDPPLASRERAREVERLTEVEAQGGLALGHLLEQPGLGSILDVADRKRADAERAAPAERRAVGVQSPPLRCREAAPR